jgi:diaminopimelate decarboxylase
MNSSTTIPAPAKPASPPDLVADLVARNFGSVNGELLVGGVPISELAKRYGTPLFVYDQQMLERQWRLLRETYPERFSLHYSVKANPNQEILKFFLGRGVGLEIASLGELHQALAAGCDPANILFAGPGKTVEELAAALDAGIGEIHVESQTEARRLAQLAEKNQRKAKIALRVNPAAEVEGGGMRMGAKPVAFGLDEDQLDALLDQLQDERWLDVVGLHLYVGTQILDHDTLLRQYRAALDIARRISARIGKPLETIDFGGGLGVPYFAHEQRLDTAALKLGLEQFVKEVAADPAISSARLIVEPGRFLVAESGVYLAEIVDIKTSRGKKFAITNGGMHHHLAASGNLGQTIKRNFPVALVNKLDEPASEEIEVVGPLCTPLDVLARSIKLPPAEIGDLIGVFQSGAYARAASPLGFLSHPSPPEVLVDQGCHRSIRRRGGVEDYLSDQ